MGGTENRVLSAEARKMRAQLRKLIGANEADVIKQAGQLMLTLAGDPVMRPVLAGLAKGTTLHGDGALKISKSSEVWKRCREDFRVIVALHVLRATGRLARAERLVLNPQQFRYNRSPTGSGMWSTAALIDLDVLGDCKKLKTLDLSSCEALRNIDGLADCVALEELTLERCRGLETLDGIAGNATLRTLNLSMSGITALSELTGLTGLETLALDCLHIKDVSALAALTELTTLDLSGCSELKSIAQLANLKRLETLSLSSCSELQSIDVLAELTTLRALNLTGCRSLRSVDALSTLKELRVLEIDSSGIENVDGLAGLTDVASGGYHFWSWSEPQNPHKKRFHFESDV